MIVVGVRFKPAGKIYYFDPTEIPLNLNDGVIVETARGMEYGSVVIAPRSVDSAEVVQPLKPIIRKATAKDVRQVEKNKEREKKAFSICLEKIAKHKVEIDILAGLVRDGLLKVEDAALRVDMSVEEFEAAMPK